MMYRAIPDKHNTINSALYVLFPKNNLGPLPVVLVNLRIVGGPAPAIRTNNPPAVEV